MVVYKIVVSGVVLSLFSGIIGYVVQTIRNIRKKRLNKMLDKYINI